MTEERVFPAGTIGTCNRCDHKFTYRKPVRAVRENSCAWRVMDFATTDTCGHMDTHWVFDRDNQESAR